MPQKYKKSIFVFTRDLRLKDNTSLLKATKESNIVIPIFIFNPKQIKSNSYKSDNCVQFMCECLDELNNELKKKGSKIFYFYDEHDDVMDSLLKSDRDIEAVYINFDYTPFARKRSQQIERICKHYDVVFCEEEDYMLTGKDDIVTSEGKPYSKFTPFYNKAKFHKVNSPNNSNPNNYASNRTKFPKEYTNDIHKFYDKYNEDISVYGGRNAALKILRGLKKFKNYNKDRDYPILPTTRLSAYLKFNVVSVREVYDAFKSGLGLKNDLLKQLYWRDFYMNIIFHYPYVIDKSDLKNKDGIKWNYDSNWFKKWKNGKTGYPLVDAGIREMNKSGFMHNRPRMITANFLVKVLRIDWRLGEKYFAQKLVDYDPSNNTGGWIWSASVYGIDSQPYFRIFNPMLQIKRFDEDCEYIKKWIPELKDVSNKDIAKWDEKYREYKHVKYPKPMVNYDKEKNKTITMYKNKNKN